jgi:hypothetical protein
MFEAMFNQTQWLRAKIAVEQLRAQFPTATDARLVRQVIKLACVKAGATGAGSTAVSLIPGVGTMLKWAVSLGGDVALTASVQRDLVLQIFAIHRHEPQAEDQAQISQWLSTVGVGGIEIAEQIGGSVFKRVAKNLFGKVFRRGLPLAEVIASTGTHVISTYVLGRKADSFCRTGKALALKDALGDLDPRRTRNWMMMSFDTHLEDSPKTVKDALKQQDQD